MKSEQTKSRKSLYLKMTSLVTGLLIPVFGFLLLLNSSIDGAAVLLINFGFIALGLLTIKTARLAKFTGGVILGIIEVLFFAFLLFGFTFFLAQELAEKKVCHNQMQRLSSVCQEYCEQNEGILPVADTWCDQLFEAVENAENDYRADTLNCYGHNGYEGKMSPYAFNKKLDGYRLGDIDRQTVLLFLSGPSWNQNGTSDILASKEPTALSDFPQKGYYFVFVGPGSTFTVEFVKKSEIDDLNWEPTEQPAVAE